MSLQEITSQRGKPMLVFKIGKNENFKYNMYRVLSSGEVQWRCNKHGCRAYLNTVGEASDRKVKSKDDIHTHEPYSDVDIQRQVVTTAAKRKASDNFLEKPSSIIKKCVEESSSHDLNHIDIGNVRKRVYETRKKLMPVSPKDRDGVSKCSTDDDDDELENNEGVSKCLTDDDDDELETNERENFLLFNSPELVIFGCNTNLNRSVDRARLLSILILSRK